MHCIQERCNAQRNDRMGTTKIQEATQDRPYVYTSLAEACNFRLLYLEPGTLDSPHFHGSLKAFNLDFSPAYECLSYVWGTGPKSGKIIIDGGYIPITETLIAALRYLRKSDAIRVLWIDQICINQEDLGERSEQVQLMRQLYRGSERDILWLGAENEDSSTALGWIQGLIDAWPEFTKDIDKNGWDYNAYSIWLDSMDAYMPSVQQQTALEKTFQLNPIWRRIWIVQELILSPEVVLLGGTMEVKWLYLRRLFSLFVAIRPPTSEKTRLYFVAKMLTRFVALDAFRDQDSTISNSPFLQILHLFRGWKATDSRDMVYGVLSLAKDIQIRPDYTKAPCRVYLETTTTVIKQAQNLNVICFDQEEPQVSNDDALDLPSWVLDLGRMWGNFMPVQFSEDEVPSFSAGTPPSHGLSNGVPFVISGSSLSARGLHIDYIDSISAVDVQNLSDSERHIQLFNIVLEYTGPTLTAANIMNTKQDAIWCTLIRSHDTSWSRLYEHDFPAYRAQFCDWYIAVCSQNMESLLADPSRFVKSLINVNFGAQRRLAVTARHRLLVSVPPCSKPGDEICILETAHVPLAIQRVGGGKDVVTCKRLGTAYVHGVMDGEAWMQEDKYPPCKYEMI